MEAEKRLTVARHAQTQTMVGLSKAVLEIEGMSNHAMREFLNALGWVSKNYVEVGSYHGSTLCAVAFGNEGIKLTAIEDFSEQFNQWGVATEESLMSNVEKFAPQAKVINNPFQSVDLAEIPDNVDLYLYDGAHDYESQRLGVSWLKSKYADHTVLLVDDWKGQEARDGTYAGLNELYDEFDVYSHHAYWDLWNGVGAFALKRKSV